MTTPAPSTIDLHCHSTASDGLLTPTELVTYASGRGVSTIALTDHDSTSGIEQAVATGTELGVTVIPGVELSSEIEGLQAHILGYFLDPRSESLQREFAWMNESRRERVIRIVENLQRAGVQIDSAEVFALSDGGTIGRPHVARVLVEHGYAQDVADAFTRYLVEGKPGYATSDKITPEGAIQLIAAAGGVAVLAHPLSTRDPAGAVARLAPAGLIGLECFYGAYPVETHHELTKLADRYGLIPTGGSDFHGIGVKSTDLGGVIVPMESVIALREAAESNRRHHPETR